jgi:putative ABC transport system ATP-binding protein
MELLAAYGRGLESRLDQEAGRLSGGERQLLAVIMGVMEGPSVLLLDEHTSALDPQMGALVMRLTDELIREQGLTTIMVTHNMRYAAQYGDRLLIMSGGVIVDDIRAEQKRGITEDGLIRRFRDAVAGELTDRLIGGS